MCVPVGDVTCYGGQKIGYMEILEQKFWGLKTQDYGAGTSDIYDSRN